MPTTSPPSTLGTNIRQAREAMGMSQQALALAMGRKGEDAGAFISRIENGHEPKLDTIRRIAQQLGVGVDVLILGNGK